MTHQPHNQFKYLSLLVSLSVTCMLIAVILPYKIVEIGYFIVPGGVFVFPISYALGDVITEVYGYKLARQMIWITIATIVFYSIVISLVIHAPSPGFWHLQTAYNEVLGSSPRVLLGFIAGMLVSSFSNIAAISHWKILLKGKFFWLRSIGASVIGEAVFSIVAGAIIYLGVIPFQKYLHLTFSVWLIKIAYNVIITYPSAILVNFLKTVEKVDAYDYGANFNPFRFTAASDSKR